MAQNIVLALVIIVSLWAHLWLYLWIRFKMDEGAVLRCLVDSPSQLSSEAIAELAKMKHDRVVKVCQKSKEICQDGELYFSK